MDKRLGDGEQSYFLTERCPDSYSRFREDSLQNYYTLLRSLENDSALLLICNIQEFEKSFDVSRQSLKIKIGIRNQPKKPQILCDTSIEESKHQRTSDVSANEKNMSINSYSEPYQVLHTVFDYCNFFWVLVISKKLKAKKNMHFL